jgi:Predicted membrane protein
MEQAVIFFDSWGKVWRSVLLAFFAYLILVFLLRISGKRTLSKLNVFDFVFVVALGSTLATTILSPGTTLTDGLTAFIVLIGLQVGLSLLCVYSYKVDSIVNGEPSLLLHRGNFLDETMKRERVTKEEVLAALRNSGVKTYNKVDSVVLETDGTFSIVWRPVGDDCSTLADVKGHPEFRSESIHLKKASRRREQQAVH